MTKNLMQKVGLEAPSHERSSRRTTTGAKARLANPLQDAKETEQSYSPDFKYIQPLFDKDTDQNGDPPSNEGGKVLSFPHPSPSEGKGREVDEECRNLKARLTEIRTEDPDRFDQALSQMGFVTASSIITDRGWVKKSALPADLAAKQRADDVKRNKDYRTQRSPEKAAAQTAQQTATQRIRRMKKRLAGQAVKPT